MSLETPAILTKARAYALKNALSHDGVAAKGPVISALLGEGLDRSALPDLMPALEKVVLSVNEMSLEEQQTAFTEVENEVHTRKQREGLPELPGGERGVVMRFAPSASGPLHLAHAITAAFSYSYVKRYGGRMILRIEDTNPENIFPAAYDLLTEDAQWLCEGNAEIIIQSDRMDLYYDYAQRLLEGGHAYVCTCTGDAFRERAQEKTACPCRGINPEVHLDRWASMLDKEGYQEGEAVLRFKSDMAHKNPAMRDFPLARVNTVSHPRQANKYRVWPLMNLAVSVDDMELGMTHIIRGKDHRDNAERQKLIYAALEKTPPWTAFVGRMHVTGMTLSTTAFREAIAKGTYTGWDDERLPTVASLRKQGYPPEVFTLFAERLGISENDKTIDREEVFHLLNDFRKRVAS